MATDAPPRRRNAAAGGTRPRDSGATEAPEPNGHTEARGRAARTGAKRGWGKPQPNMGGSGRVGRTSAEPRTERDTRRSGATAERGGAGRNEGEAQAQGDRADATRRARAGGARRDPIHKGKFSVQPLGVRHLRASWVEIYSGVTATAKGFHKGKFTFVNSRLRISLYKLIFSYVNRRLHL